MLVRTRPSDRARVVVTEAEAVRLEAEWDLHRLRQQLPEFDRNETDKELAHPQDADLILALLQRQRLEHSTTREWSLYRNDTLAMAEFLLSDGDGTAALPHLLDVCSLDAWLEEDLERSTDLPLSPLEDSFAPGVVGMLADALDETNTEVSGLASILEARRTELPMLSGWQVSSGALSAALQKAIESAI